MPLLGDARLPAGLRVYAIGDIHGCLDHLTVLHEAVARDLEAHPVADHRLVHLGDYIDRGPDSAGVLSLLAGRAAADRRVICLYGNHEAEIEGFFDDPDRWRGPWLRYGGNETLRSYGIDAIALGHDQLNAAFAAVFPESHRAFIAGCTKMARFGDFLFVHAGIRPGVAPEDQDTEDLIWIREPFLSDDRDHGAVVVHGHTPVDVPEVRRNRINIDTGAVYGGVLTCLVVEGGEFRFLEAGP